MSTYSPNLRIELITDGTQAGTWGSTTNGSLAYVLDSSIAGYQTVSVTAANQYLTYTNGATATVGDNQSVYAMLRFTTTTGAAFAVYAPPASKAYIVWNNSGYSMTIYNSSVIGNTTAAGTGVTVTNGSKIMVWSDATNFYELQAANLTGTLAIANGGTSATTAAGARTSLGLAIGTDVPSPTGTGASGTWSINVTGSAGSATNATLATTATLATLATSATLATLATSAGFATNAGAATNAGFATNATFASSATNATLATLATSATALSTASGSAPSYSARAWVNFDGTGTISIRASGNVSSITDGGAGIYGVNFSTAMQDANYCVQVASLVVTASNSFNNPTSITTSTINIDHVENNFFVDTTSMYVAAFR